MNIITMCHLYTMYYYLNVCLNILYVSVYIQEGGEREKALDNELEGARRDFKELNSQLDQAEAKIKGLMTDCKEKDTSIETHKKELELLSKTSQEEKTLLEREMASLQDQLQSTKTQSAQVIYT